MAIATGQITELVSEANCLDPDPNCLIWTCLLCSGSFSWVNVIKGARWSKLWILVMSSMGEGSTWFSLLCSFCWFEEMLSGVFSFVF